MAYAFDPTGRALQNKVLGEEATLALPSGKNYLYYIPAQAPFFPDSFAVKFRNTSGVERILVPGVDYEFSHQFMAASKACNTPIYGSIKLNPKTLTGTIWVTYQTLGGSWTISSSAISNIYANEYRDPAVTSWDAVVQPTLNFPVIEHRWSVVNVDDVREVVDRLDSVGIVVHLRPRFLAAPGDEVYIPGKTEVGLGNVDNYATATTTQADAGTSTTHFTTPAIVKYMIEKFAPTGSGGGGAATTTRDITHGSAILYDYLQTQAQKVTSLVTLTSSLSTNKADKTTVTALQGSITAIQNLISQLGTLYAAIGHNHDTAYAAIGHTHAWSTITDRPTKVSDFTNDVDYITQSIFDLWKVPVGMVIYVPFETPPDGFLVSNGALYPKATYSALYAKVGDRYGSTATHFRIPDLRGEFIRGWDAGRGVDASRDIGSWQDDQFRSHTHNYTLTRALDETWGLETHRFGRGQDGWVVGDRTGEIYHAGGPETRPRNVALLACIKY